MVEKCCGFAAVSSLRVVRCPWLFRKCLRRSLLGIFSSKSAMFLVRVFLRANTTDHRAVHDAEPVEEVSRGRVAKPFDIASQKNPSDSKL
jgi:hypothetical protein